MTLQNLRVNLVRFTIPGLLALLSACAHNPQSVPAVVNSPDIRSVQREPGAHDQALVRWGGTVVSVTNETGTSLIEVVGRPLSRSGRPIFNDRSDGRFIAKISEFVDPELYQPNRPVTVVGKVNGTMERSIGDSDYQFPVVEVTSHQLWKSRNARFARRGYYGYPNGYSRSRYGRYHEHTYGVYGAHNEYYAHPFFDWWAFSFGWNDRWHDRHRTHFNLNWWWRN